MKPIRILIAAVIAVLGATVVAQVSTATETPPPNHNDPGYWETQTEHPSVCYKHTWNSTHGYLADGGTTVKLYPYGPSWPGDHWELLVVNSGNVDNGSGPGNAAYHHPIAGTAYAGPLNGGGQQGAVSHWIACKGEIPDEPVPTEVSWAVTNGDCDAPTGTLAVTYDPTKVDYVGDAPGSYAADTTVTGQFTAKPGNVLAGDAGPFSHTFTVDGSPCEEPADLRLELDAECAVGDVLYWRVTNVHDVDIAFTFDGPGGSTGDGIAPAGGTTFFTTAAGAEPTSIDWTNPSGGPSEAVSADAVESCVYHVSFEKIWQGVDAPDLDGAVLLTAASSLGSATCTSDDGVLGCTYELAGAPVDDLVVPYGEPYSVTEHVPGGWYVVSGTGDDFTGIAGFDHAALPGALAIAVDDDRSCTPPGQTEDECIHVVTNAPTDQAPAPVFVDPTCADRDVVVIDPDPDDDITYEIVSGTVAPGEPVTVRAVAGPGTVLVGQTEWSHEFGEIGDADCVVQGTPTSSIVADCGGATLTFTNTVGQLPAGHTGAPIEFSYTVDGEGLTLTVEPGATEVVDLDFPEDSGVHTVAIGAGTPLSVESDCESDPVEPTIDVAAFSPVCQADIPYIQYDIEVSGTDADEATLTFIDDTGEEILTLTGMPLSGSILYPGAAENPNPDWPGWRKNAAGLWVPDPTDDNWRDGLSVQIEVNPTATASVAYPPATALCAGPEIVESGAPTTTAPPTVVSTTTTPASSAVTTTPVRPRLPRTGSNGTAPLVGLGAALIGLGLVLGAVVRRPHPS